MKGFKNFQYLINIAWAYHQQGSQARAGASLGLKQETVSQHLRILEKRVGYEVFERHDTLDIIRPSLTKEGRELLDRNPPTALRESKKVAT